MSTQKLSLYFNKYLSFYLTYLLEKYFGMINIINILVDMANNDFFQKLTETHPFITVCSYAGQEFVGVVQNRDDSVTTFYDYGSIVGTDLKRTFLELGDIWWWESNRLVPINLFLKEDWVVFKPYLKTFNNKSLVILHGPATSMNEISKKRVKRKSITLVKRMI